MRNRPLITVLGIASGLVVVAGASSAHAWAGGQRPAVADVAAPAGGASELDAVLGEQDAPDATGNAASAHEVTLNAGEAVEITAASRAFDTVLSVTGPNGFHVENDDVQGGNGTDSRVRFVAPVRGNYRASVSAYEGRGEGPFRLAIARITAGPQWVAPAAVPARRPADPDADAPSDPNPDAPQAVAPRNANGGSVYGVFVGIGDYAGANHNLGYTARDAVSLEGAFERRGLLARGNAVVLTDANATRDNVRQAFAQVAPRVGPNDTFVFFFDGHGGSQQIELRDGNMNARELGRMLDGVRGEQLVVLDSCESGGLATLARGAANRVALFSSRADESSYEAPEVGAGGWLAYFVREAVRNDQGPFTFGRLVDTVQRGYAARVHNGQHLVVAEGNGRRDENVALWGAGHAPSQPTVAEREPSYEPRTMMAYPSK